MFDGSALRIQPLFFIELKHSSISLDFTLVLLGFVAGLAIYAVLFHMNLLVDGEAGNPCAPHETASVDSSCIKRNL
jgi:hypothetical protein